MNKSTKTNKDKRVITDLEDFARDDSLSVIGIVGDKHQGKSGLMFALIDIYRRFASHTKIVGFRLQTCPEGVLPLQTLTELSFVRDSVIFMDELKTIVDTDNRTDMRTFLGILQTIRHSNNKIFLSGLAHNYNGKLSGELESIIFKQTTLISVVKRSNLDYILRPLHSEGMASKNEYSLVMPKNGALIYHPHMEKQWHYVTVPYLKQYDTKLNNAPIVKWEE